MGTRSTTKFYSEWDQQEPVACIYQQWDGYFEGVGVTLAEFLKGFTVTNGIKGGRKFNNTANGMGCLAAQYIANQKTELGSFYMTHPDDEQEYNYEVRLIDGKLQIKVEGFEGTPEEFLNLVNSLVN